MDPVDWWQDLGCAYKPGDRITRLVHCPHCDWTHEPSSPCPETGRTVWERLETRRIEAELKQHQYDAHTPQGRRVPAQRANTVQRGPTVSQPEPIEDLSGVERVVAGVIVVALAWLAISFAHYFLTH